MKSLIWFCITISEVTFGLCQAPAELDSLRVLLHDSALHDQRKIAAMYARLGWSFHNNSQFDSALIYYSRALEIGVKNPKPTWIGEVQFGLGAAFGALGKQDSAIIHYKKALSFFAQAGDENNTASTHVNLSIAYKNIGLYEEALSSIITAVRILEKEEHSMRLASCYNTMALIFTKIENYDQAIKYYHEAIALFAKFNVSFQAKSYNNLGELFILTHQYDSARTNFLRATAIKRQLDDTKGIARTLSNLGKVSMLTDNLSLAEKQLKESHALQMQLNDPTGMIEVLNNLGELYLTTHRYSQSGQTLKASERIIRDAGTPEYLRQNLELQIQLARQRNDFANGMSLLEQLVTIRDSLLNEEKSRSLQAMQIRYETEKKEQQLALFQQREEFNQARIRNGRITIGALVLGLILAGTIGLLIYINLRNARASKEKIELLLAETHHRIKNNFQTLASIFHLQTRHYTDHEMVLEARNSESRVHTMSLLHEKFYLAEPGNTVHVRTYVVDLVHKLVDIYGVSTRNLALSIEVDDIELDIDKVLALSLIIQELVCNAFKYAFDHEPEPELSVAIRSKNDNVTATIHDNGIGLNDSPSPTSQGFNLVESLVAQLDGKMQVVNKRGTTFTIQFPLTPPWKKRLFS